VDAGYTEAASHSRSHPCTDADYQVHGYDWEVTGSRDDLLANLRLPAGRVQSFIEPCGFESAPGRQAIAAARYLAHRSAGTGWTTFSAWSADGAYTPAGTTTNTAKWPQGAATNTERDQANAAFDGAYRAGGVYHILDHPWQGHWSSGSALDQHAAYVAGR